MIAILATSWIPQTDPARSLRNIIVGRRGVAARYRTDVLAERGCISRPLNVTAPVGKIAVQLFRSGATLEDRLRPMPLHLELAKLQLVRLRGSRLVPVHEYENLLAHFIDRNSGDHSRLVTEESAGLDEVNARGTCTPLQNSVDTDEIVRNNLPSGIKRRPSAEHDAFHDAIRRQDHLAIGRNDEGRGSESCSR